MKPKCCETCFFCEGRVRGSMEFAQCSRFSTYCDIAMKYHCDIYKLKFWTPREENKVETEFSVSVYDCIPDKESDPEISKWNKFKKWFFGIK